MSTEQKSNSEQRFFPIPVDALDHDVLQMDLFIKFTGQHGPPTLYRSSGLKFTPEDTERLASQNVKFLYIPGGQHHVFRKNLVERLDRTFKEPGKAKAERAKVIRDVCAKMIEDVLLFPGDAEPVAAVADISRNFADWSASDPDGFSYLLNMSSHDFYTATHMVNVGVGCGLLAKEVRAGDREFFTLAVQGGLLHDVGKRGVPTELLNKEGKLTPEEWKVMSSHPANGYEELKQNPAIPEMVLSMVRDHHERLDGKGYPNKIDATQISVPARICAIVDVFDAITAARPYRGPTPPADTLKIMRDGRGTQFDPEMFDIWERIVGKMLETDPARAPAPSPEGPKLKLAGVSDQDPSHEHPTPPSIERNLYADERRRFARYAVTIQASAQFVRAGKKMPVQKGETFTVQIVDIGRGGIQIQTPWPLSLNDLLLVEIAIPGQPQKVTRLSRVVRVRRTKDGKWASGMAFMEAESKAAA